ncbi:conserved hypothetical protein [Rubrivivax sp. A210]|uniref:DUF1365 domain-containing protein n=1 Tax=Rubrivivax sp. A210 TaxID=2772301 RepID=UPI00191AF022|nr:DUF1365 domain-containing protein [Rubrivivax sp. A210]CAD5367021.1 conserved hypothetical protein [Rubrivivax sp. A210]
MSHSAGAAKPALAQLAWGQVRHVRHRPAAHAFAYPTAFLLLPMRALATQANPALARNRAALLSFRDADHGDGGPDALAWVEALLAQHGIADVDGEIWLQTFPRVAGFVFKPVSFWYCLAADGRLRAVVAEVNNTFGERHCYVLDDPSLAWGATVEASKVFHVSPFCEVKGRYRFRFARTADRVVARVELDDNEGPLLITSVSGHTEPLTKARVRATLLRMPLLTLAIVARIQWQALQLWLKRVPWFRKPPYPATASQAQAPQPLPEAKAR